MREAGIRAGRGARLLLIATAAVLFSNYVHLVSSFPVDMNTVHQWPTFPRRNIAALARDGYLRNSLNNFKRSISTLAKNGQLPTFRSPYDDTDKQEQDEDESSQEKRNMASIARMRSYAAVKRNIQALARDGYRLGRGQNQQSDKRNVQALARNGLLHKRDMANEDEYYYPFYQNPIPPLSEIDGPFDMNELYDYQQSINPDMFPPLSQVFKKSMSGYIPQSEYQYYNDETPNLIDAGDSWYLKRGSVGLPAHGLLRPTYVEPSARTKRYILSLPAELDHNDISVPPEDNQDLENNDKRSVDDESEAHDNYEKRHIGSLARLGLLPSFRFSGGRYLRSGRARLLWPSQELYRKHSANPNFGIRQYITSAEAEPAADPDDSDVPAEAVPAHSHPTGRILHRPLNNDLPSAPSPPLPSPQLPPLEPFAKNRWQSPSKEIPKFYYFRSLKVPYHQSGKRYLLLPAVDNILLRKNYPNSSLPSRRKNQ
ncbi:unnamed protein product [Plutella xylostella]|uniref:(diamondback moth) hypothetical protein n=1 Tax=Plutella xylostella TaxID=51655 RepID=A0A8S4FPV6_PLUXY|nr:unnamed protein product [Plutella xylostella]